MWVLFGSFFMFSNFYQLGLLNTNFVTLVNMQWKIDKNRTSHDLVMVIESAYLWTLKKNTWILPVVVIVEYVVLVNIWRPSPISFKHVSLLWLLFDAHRPPSEQRGPIKKRNQLTCAYLKERKTIDKLRARDHTENKYICTWNVVVNSLKSQE